MHDHLEDKWIQGLRSWTLNIQPIEINSTLGMSDWDHGLLWNISAKFWQLGNLLEEQITEFDLLPLNLHRQEVPHKWN